MPQGRRFLVETGRNLGPRMNVPFEKVRVSHDPTAGDIALISENLEFCDTERPWKIRSIAVVLGELLEQCQRRILNNISNRPLIPNQ